MATINPFFGVWGRSARKRWLKAQASLAGSGNCDASPDRAVLSQKGKAKRCTIACSEARSVAMSQSRRSRVSTGSLGPASCQGNSVRSSKVARLWMSAGEHLKWAVRIVPSVESRFGKTALHEGTCALQELLRSTASGSKSKYPLDPGLRRLRPGLIETAFQAENML